MDQSNSEYPLKNYYIGLAARKKNPLLH